MFYFLCKSIEMRSFLFLNNEKNFFFLDLYKKNDYFDFKMISF